MKNETPSKSNKQFRSSDTGKLIESRHYLRSILKRELSISSDSSIDNESEPTTKIDTKEALQAKLPAKKHAQNIIDERASKKIEKP